MGLRRVHFHVGRRGPSLRRGCTLFNGGIMQSRNLALALAAVGIAAASSLAAAEDIEILHLMLFDFETRFEL